MLRSWSLKTLVLPVAALAILAVACSSSDDPAPTPVPAADLQQMIQDAVGTIQQGASAAEIQSLVETAVMDSASGAMTAADVEAAVRGATAGQLSAAQVQSIVDQSVRALPAPEVNLSDLRSLVAQSVADSVPDSVSAAQINAMVQAAVNAAQAGAVTRGDLEDLVAASIQEAADGQLTGAQVEAIVTASLVATNAAIDNAAMAAQGAESAAQMALEEAQQAALLAAGAPYIPETCVSVGEIITDCPLRSPHIWQPNERQVPGKVWVFQDAYQGPKPTQFFESPYSAQLVAQGVIPPLEQRLPVPEDVEVIAGPDGIGEFGGFYHQTERHNYIGEWITASWNRRDSVGGLKWFPWIGKGWEVSEDGRTWTFTMRERLKWNDGLPLDMESIEFAWYLNFHPELMPNLPLWISDQVTLGAPEFNVVDDLTWTLTYDTPIFTIMEQRATPSGLCGPGTVCISAAPKMKKYYYDFASKASVDAFIAEGDHADWKSLLSSKWNIYNNIVEIPCAAPWCATSDSDSFAEWEKNQFNWFVDPEGNQLPYTDGATMTKVESRDVAVFRSMAGEMDGRTSIFLPSELPLYVSNMDKGDYSIYHWPSSGGSEMPARLQQTFNDDPYIGELIRTQDFRLALSHALDRDQYNEVVLSGIGLVQNRVPRPDNPYYPGDQYKTINIEHDVAKSNALLDGLGLTTKDAAGMRMRADGAGPISIAFNIGSNPQQVAAAELWKDAWSQVGISATINSGDTSCWRTSTCTTTISSDDAAYQYNPWMVQWTSLVSLSTNGTGAEIGTYYASKGESGMAPTGGDAAWMPLAPADTFPADPLGLMKDGSDTYLEGISFAQLDPRRIEIAKNMFINNTEQLWSLNAIGFSGAFRGLYLNRNNMRNKPITHERDHNGFTAWARFFDEGLDNYHHPGNKSKFCNSWAFIQGGSPYDRCTN
jgi:peptide/nickel transport system substrate-binding protein